MSTANLHLDDFATIERRDAAWRKGRVVGARTSPSMRPALDRAVMVEAINQLALTYVIQPQDIARAFSVAAKNLGRTT